MVHKYSITFPISTLFIAHLVFSRTLSLLVFIIFVRSMIKRNNTERISTCSQ